MVLSHFTQNLKNLKCQFPGRRYYQNSQSICWSPLKAIEEFQSLKKKLPHSHYINLRRKIHNKKCHRKDDVTLIQIMSTGEYAFQAGWLMDIRCTNRQEISLVLREPETDWQTRKKSISAALISDTQEYHTHMLYRSIPPNIIIQLSPRLFLLLWIYTTEIQP